MKSNPAYVELACGVEKFNMNINAINEEETVKNLISHCIEDINLNDSIDINNCGQGVQRHLIYTLIILSAKI